MYIGEQIYWHGRYYNTNSLENLITFKDMTEEKQKEIARMGGVASGKARRQKRALKELCMYQLEKQLMIEGWLETDLADFREWQKQKRKAERKKKRC